MKTTAQVLFTKTYLSIKSESAISRSTRPVIITPENSSQLPHCDYLTYLLTFAFSHIFRHFPANFNNSCINLHTIKELSSFPFYHSFPQKWHLIDMLNSLSTTQ